MLTCAPNRARAGKDLDQIMGRGAPGHVGAAPENQGGRPGDEEWRQEGLGDEGDGTGAAGLLRHVD